MTRDEAWAALESERAADRLYAALAFFDTRDGSFEANLARAAREGYERSRPEMDESSAWDELDRLMQRHPCKAA